MKPEIIKKYTDNENGIESRIVKTERGLVVGIWDIEENESYGNVIIFPYDMIDNEKKAYEYFDKINSSKYEVSYLL